MVFYNLVGPDLPELDHRLALDHTEPLDLPHVEVVPSGDPGPRHREEHLSPGELLEDLSEIATVVGVDLGIDRKVVGLDEGPERVEEGGVERPVQVGDDMAVQVPPLELAEAGEDFAYVPLCGGTQGTTGVS